MSVKTSYYGSIDFTKLVEMAKAGNKAFTKTENGKIYLNVRIWVNDELDKFGNVASFQSNFKGAQKEDKFYFGNLKESTPTEEKVEPTDVNVDLDSLPF
jgi:hypothetical protein